MGIYGSNGSTYSLSNYRVAKFLNGATTSFNTQASVSPQSSKEASEDKSKTEELKQESSLAIDARAKLTDRYGDLDTTSAKYSDDLDAFRRDIFDDLNFDRQTLYTIASNENGYFSKEEVEAAKQSMEEQLDEVLNKDAPETGPTAENYLSLLQYLENECSEEEKASFEWAKSVASAQSNYNRLSEDTGSKQVSDDPVIELLTKAYDELHEEQKTNPKAKLDSMPSYNSAEYLWGRNNNTYEEYSSPHPW